MPPKKDYDRIFLPFTVAVEKKINKLALFMERLEDDDTISEFQLRVLITHAEALRGNLARMEANWDRLRDGIAQRDESRLTDLVVTSIADAEAALLKAEMFACEAEARPSTRRGGRVARPEDASDPGPSRPKLDKLDNSIRPTTQLSRNMDLEEASRWIKSFDSYFTWNEPIISKKTPENLRALLESCLEAGLVAKLHTDNAVRADTPIQGTGGLLEVLGKYFVDDYPLINRLHAFSTCKQARGELFKTWWDTKLRKATECDLDGMRGTDWLALELIRGVSDAELQKKLLLEQDPALHRLVRIAEQWQAADSAQTAFGTEAAEFIRQTTCTEEAQEDTEIVRKASNYKREINERWKENRQQQDCRSPYNRQQGDRRPPPPPNDRQRVDQRTPTIAEC